MDVIRFVYLSGSMDLVWGVILNCLVSFQLAIRIMGCHGESSWRFHA